MAIRERDNGAQALVKRLGGQATVSVGVQGSKADAQHKGAKLTGNTVAEIATIHEFGIGVPPRSFIAAYVDENINELQVRMAKVGDAVRSGKMDVQTALDRFGLFVVGGIQQRIKAGIPPKLDDKTKKRKGSSIPLIDTGQLRSSITYEVVSKKAAR